MSKLKPQVCACREQHGAGWKCQDHLSIQKVNSMTDPLINYRELSSSEKTGFIGDPQLITLLPGTKIFRLDNGSSPEFIDRDTQKPALSGWWSLVNPAPYNRDDMGAKGVYETAVLNGIDFSSMVRYFSAVKLEWNTLANYVEVTIGSQKINAWYGKFAPMSLSDGLDQSKYQQLAAEAKVDSSKRAPKSPQELRFNLKSQDKAFSGMSEDFLRGQTKGAASHWDTVDLNQAGITETEKQKLALLEGMALGLFDAYQLFIPNFNNSYLAGGALRTFFNAKTQMTELAQHFGSTAKPDPRRRPGF